MIHIYSCRVYKFNTEELIDTIHCLGFSIFQATHVFQEYVHGKGNRFGFPVEISDVSRVRGINDIINPEFVIEMLDEDDEDGEESFHGRKYDGSIPINVAKNLRDDQTLTFTCQCHEKITIPSNMGFPFVKCPNCEIDILPSEIKNIGGIYIYEKREPKK